MAIRSRIDQHRFGIRPQVLLNARRGIVVQVGERLAVQVPEVFEQHFQAILLVRDSVTDAFHLGRRAKKSAMLCDFVAQASLENIRHFGRPTVLVGR